MLTLDQVRALEARVEKALSLISSLRTENTSLRTGLAAAEKRVAELEGLVQDFQLDQERIEAGILEALRKLDAFEDAVQTGQASSTADQPVGETPASDANLDIF